jgi:hypothetical protein
MTPPLRILIADDERDTVFTLMQLLRDDGHDTRGVYKGGDVMPLRAVGMSHATFAGATGKAVLSSLPKALRPGGLAAADQQSLDAAQRA